MEKWVLALEEILCFYWHFHVAYDSSFSSFLVNFWH
jgi:hypothetical protein